MIFWVRTGMIMAPTTAMEMMETTIQKMNFRTNLDKLYDFVPLISEMVMITLFLKN